MRARYVLEISGAIPAAVVSNGLLIVAFRPPLDVGSTATLANAEAACTSGTNLLLLMACELVEAHKDRILQIAAAKPV